MLILVVTRYKGKKKLDAANEAKNPNRCLTLYCVCLFSCISAISGIGFVVTLDMDTFLWRAYIVRALLTCHTSKHMRS